MVMLSINLSMRMAATTTGAWQAVGGKKIASIATWQGKLRGILQQIFLTHPTHRAFCQTGLPGTQEIAVWSPTAHANPPALCTGYAHLHGRHAGNDRPVEDCSA
jgi:hypothetical protein